MARKVVDVLSRAHVMTSDLPSFLPVIPLRYLCFADRGARIFREGLRMGAYQTNSSVPYECTLGVLERDLVPISDIGFSLLRRPSQGVRLQTLELAHPIEMSLQPKT